MAIGTQHSILGRPVIFTASDGKEYVGFIIGASDDVVNIFVPDGLSTHSSVQESDEAVPFSWRYIPNEDV